MMFNPQEIARFRRTTESYGKSAFTNGMMTDRRRCSNCHEYKRTKGGKIRNGKFGGFICADCVAEGATL